MMAPRIHEWAELHHQPVVIVVELGLGYGKLLFPETHDDSDLRAAEGRVDVEPDALVADCRYTGDSAPLLADDVDPRGPLKAQLGDRLRFALPKPWLPGIRSKSFYLVLGASGYGKLRLSQAHGGSRLRPHPFRVHVDNPHCDDVAVDGEPNGVHVIVAGGD